MYKNLLKRVKNLIIQPTQEWKQINEENKNHNDVIAEFALPLIAVCTLATFVNFIINKQVLNFELALKHSVIAFSSLFGGLYIASFAIKLIFDKYGFIDSKNAAFRVATYSSVLYYITTFVSSLVPELFLLHIAIFYSFIIIYHGLVNNLNITKEQIAIISIYIFILIHIIPYFVKYFLLKLITL